MPTERHQLQPPAISIENDGPRLIKTNYWQTANCAAGLFYLTANAGCVRLLVPPSRERDIPEMTKNLREVVLTRGMFEGVANCVEVMFEDASDAPYCIHIDPKQIDRRWSPRDEGKRWEFALYTARGAIGDWGLAIIPCYLRSHPVLPYGQPRA